MEPVCKKGDVYQGMAHKKPPQKKPTRKKTRTHTKKRNYKSKNSPVPNLRGKHPAPRAPPPPPPPPPPPKKIKGAQLRLYKHAYIKQ